MPSVTDSLTAYLLLKAEVLGIVIALRQPQVDRAAIGSRIAKALSSFEELARPAGPEGHAVVPQTHEMPDVVLAKRAGDPGKCSDCNGEPCQCWNHLSKVGLKRRPNGSYSIMFKSDWTETDKFMWLKAAKMVLLKR